MIMMLGSRQYSGLHKIVEDDGDISHGLDRIPPSRSSAKGRRATVTVDGGRLLNRPTSVERRLTLDSVGTLSPIKYSHGNPQQGVRHDPPHKEDYPHTPPRSSPDMPESTRGQTRQRGDSVESDIPSARSIFPGARSQSLASPHQLSETEKRYLASLNQRRDGVDTAMLPPLGGGYKPGRGEAGRWSLPTGFGGNNMRTSSFGSNTSEIQPKTPMHITRLKREDSFGFQEELYKVDMEDGLTYVCRKRADSITNPELMTEDERRILEFLQGAARLSLKNSSTSSSSENTNDDRFHRSHRIYSLGESKLVVDPVMSKFAARSQSSRQRRKRLEERTSHQKPLSLPPIFRQVAFQPHERDLSIPPPGPRTTPEFTDEVVEELSQCRYLRPPLRKFQDSAEDIPEEEEDSEGY